MGQDFVAHEGSILTLMMFGPEGQYVEGTGEVKVVRVWLVIKAEKSNRC